MSYNLRDYGTLQFILDRVCERTGVSHELIKGKSRLPDIKNARHLVCYYSYLHTDRSFVEIGSFLGKHYSTVMNAIDYITDVLENYDLTGYADKVTFDSLHLDWLFRTNAIKYYGNEELERRRKSASVRSSRGENGGATEGSGEYNEAVTRWISRLVNDEKGRGIRKCSNSVHRLIKEDKDRESRLRKEGSDNSRGTGFEPNFED